MLADKLTNIYFNTLTSYTQIESLLYFAKKVFYKRIYSAKHRC